MCIQRGTNRRRLNKRSRISPNIRSPFDQGGTLKGDIKINTSTHNEEKLKQAIAGLDEVFGGYEVRNPVEGCPHCVIEDYQRQLASKPLRDLTSDDLAQYMFKALTTWGNEHDFKAHLPRILELTATDAALPVDPEIVLGKLDYTHWLEWPAEERKAVRAYLDALWIDTLKRYPAVLTAKECFDSAVYVCREVEPFLDVWRLNDSISVVRHLAEYINGHAEKLLSKKGRLSVFPPADSALEQQIIDWLRQPETRLRLEAAFFRYLNESFAEDLSRAVDVLAII